MHPLEISVTACIHLILNDPTTGVPVSTGSAVFIKYRDRFFICTAEHVAAYKNCTVNIITGMVKDNQSVLYEFGTFSFIEKGTLAEPTKEALLNFLNGDREFSDIAFRESNLINNVIQPARKIPLGELGALDIKQDGKSIILVDHQFEIDRNEAYSFFGRTNTKIENGIIDFKERIYYGLTLHEVMDEYIAFDLGRPIEDHENFEGCSGAPIFDSKGRLVALLTHGDDDVNSSIIYGFRFDVTKQYIDLMYFSGI